MRAITILLIYILTFFIGGCDMDISNPQTFDHIKEINGEIIQPKLVEPFGFDPAKVQTDAIIWRDKEADEYHLPPAIVDNAGRIIRQKIMAYTEFDPSKVYTTPAVLQDLNSIFLYLPPGILGANSNVIMHKIIDIGDWNMNSVETKNVAHGLTWTNIVSVVALIRISNDTVRTMLCGSTKEMVDDLQMGRIDIDDTNIMLVRAEGGFFDSSFYELTPFNRGTVFITYTG